MTLPLQLGVLLGTQDKPDSSRPSHGDVSLDGVPGFFCSDFTPAIVHLDDFVGSGEGERSFEGGLAVLLDKADLPTTPTHEVHQHAMTRRLPSVHRVHKPRHDRIVGETKAKLSTKPQVSEKVAAYAN